jgi:hypothetical protein
MIKSGFTPCLPAVRARIQALARLKWIFSLGLAALFSLSATAATLPPDQQNPDEQFIHIMAIIDRADALQAAGKIDAARVKYREAQTNLVIFKAYNPMFDPKTVAYRLNEVTEKAGARPRLPESTEPVVAPKTNSQAESGASGSKSMVKLIDAGAEPRQVLRLHVKAGDKQLAIMTMKMKMDMPAPAGGAPPTNSMNIPAMTLPMDVTVESVAANGDITYQSVIGEAGVVDEPGVAPQMAQAMKTAIAKIKGLTTTGVMSSRGMSKKVDVKAPPDADPQLRQSVAQMKQAMSNLGVPTPEEAVGPGAKWEVKMPVVTQGMTLEQTADYQLVSAQGDQVSTTFTLAQNAANQKIQNPAMGNMQMNLIQLTTTGNGSVTADLSKLVALQATMNMQMDMNAEVTAGGKTQPFAMKMGMDISMESK